MNIKDIPVGVSKSGFHGRLVAYRVREGAVIESYDNIPGQAGWSVAGTVFIPITNRSDRLAAIRAQKNKVVRQ